MFITMPIKSFKLDGNKVLVNESVIEYENISDDTREILESLISKGAYGSALLTLNMFYNVKSINESDYTQEDYTKYLKECNKLMEECVSETEAHNFRPLVNLNGLEIMENENYIARGKGNKLLIEDFRNQKLLKEDSYEDQFFQDIENALIDAGFDVDRFSDMGVLTKNLGWYVSNSEGEVQLQCNGTYLDESVKLNEEMSPWMKYQTQAEQLFDNAKAELDEDMFSDFCNMIGTMAKDYEFGYNEDMYESVDAKDKYTGNSHADEIVFDFSQTERDVNTFTNALNEISRMEFDNEIDKEKYDECIKKLQSLFKDKDKSIDELNEECEGTQCSDIAEKKDQEVGSLQKPKKPKKHFVEMFKVPRKHGFKGFRLNENGYYTRGNYILINEDGCIKAVNKDKLTENTDIDLLYKTLHLDQDLEKAMVKGVSKVLYIEEDEVKDYCSIEFEEDEDNSDYVRVYFLAEVSYEEGTRVVDEYLDDVISKYDKDAYFEAETSGRWLALVRKECLN